MTWAPTSGQRYDMPALFGPSIIPDRTAVPDAQVLVLSYQTEREPALDLVPSHFTIPDTPILSVSYIKYPTVDYLGGRAYKEIVISISAEYLRADEKISASYSPILWVDECGPLMSGREFMGLHKLMATIPDLDDASGIARFTCREYDAELIAGEARELRPLDEVQLAKLNSRSAEVQTFGWKLIAGQAGIADIDCPLVNVMRWKYRQAWSGTGSVNFKTPDRAAAPFSSSALARLAGLPVKGPVRAFRGIGEALIDRAATRRLIPDF